MTRFHGKNNEKCTFTVFRQERKIKTYLFLFKYYEIKVFDDALGM